MRILPRRFASVVAVALPAALPLFLSALAGLAFIGRRRPQFGRTNQLPHGDRGVR